MQWLQNLTLVIHVVLSLHFILKELEKQFISLIPVKFCLEGDSCMKLL